MHAKLIFTVSFLAIATAQSTGKLGDAPVVTRNPGGIVYSADFRQKGAALYGVRGSATIGAEVTGRGAFFEMVISGLPSEGGPFRTMCF